MNDFLTNVPLINNLTGLVELLLLLNVVLTGGVILLGFRAAYYKRQADEAEARLNEAIGTTIIENTPEEAVTRRRARR